MGICYQAWPKSFSLLKPDKSIKKLLSPRLGFPLAIALSGEAQSSFSKKDLF
jgi:hypothetical protein